MTAMSDASHVFFVFVMQLRRSSASASAHAEEKNSSHPPPHSAQPIRPSNCHERRCFFRRFCLCFCKPNERAPTAAASMAALVAGQL
jgi:hypothetical protein